MANSDSRLTTTAEWAFLSLARDWQLTAEKTPCNYEMPEKTPWNYPMPRDANETALACLMLAAEWGSGFSDRAVSQIRANVATVGRYRTLPSDSFKAALFGRGLDGISWQLCGGLVTPSPIARAAFPHLVAALLLPELVHHSSYLRCWAMEIAWFVRKWLPVERAAPLLLKNVADTLLGVVLAAGLASALFETPEAFWNYANAFTPPEPFEEQYRDRLRQLTERGTLTLQANFLQVENECRKRVERLALADEKDETRGARQIPLPFS